MAKQLRIIRNLGKKDLRYLKGALWRGETVIYLLQECLPLHKITGTGLLSPLIKGGHLWHFTSAAFELTCTWLTVVPTQPCSTICSILESAGSWFVAKANSCVFFCMSSMATSMGTRMIWRRKHNSRSWHPRCTQRITPKEPPLPQNRPPPCGSRWSASWCKGKREMWWGWFCVCTARSARRGLARPEWREYSTWSYAGCSSCQNRWLFPLAHRCRRTARRRLSGGRPEEIRTLMGTITPPEHYESGTRHKYYSTLLGSSLFLSTGLESLIILTTSSPNCSE